MVLRRESLLEVARFLKEDPALQMNFLMDLTAVDYSAFGKSPAPAFFASSGVTVRPLTQIQDEDPWPGPPGETRFAVVYHFYSLKHKHRLRMVVPVEEAEPGQPCRSWPLIHAIWAGEPHCRAVQFLRRFLLHVLPRGSVKVRYYGIWSNSCRRPTPAGQNSA